MKVKTKVSMLYPMIGFRNHRARRLAKKIKKFDDEARYSTQFKNDYIIKKAKKTLKNLNVKVEVIGIDKLPAKGTVLLTPNHASSFDVAVLMAAMENPQQGPDFVNFRAVFVGKDDIKENKKVRGYADVLNTFYIERKNPRTSLEIMDQAVKHAKEYRKHLVIFPEGTRSKDGSVGEFKGGAFNIAKKNFLPVIPVTINNTLSISNLEREGKLKVQVIFHDQIKPMTFMTSETQAIASRVQKIVESKWVKPEGSRSENEDKLV